MATEDTAGEDGGTRASPDTFSPVATARRLVREARTAALATLVRRDGSPFVSLVSVAAEADGTPVVLLSTLAAHSRNLAADARASLLFADGGIGNPQETGRITLTGRVEPIADDTVARRRYLARHPEAALYAGFADFAFHRLVVEEAHLVAGFGRAMRLRAADLLLPADLAATLVEAEPEIVERLSRDRDRIAAWAVRLGGAEGDWTVVAVDPEGVDLATLEGETRRFRRLAFQAPATTPAAVDRRLEDWERSSDVQEIS